MSVSCGCWSEEMKQGMGELYYIGNLDIDGAGC